MRDLDIRGAGNLLGGEQSGFINEIGFDTYTKILEEAIQELKETDFKDLFIEEKDRRNYVKDVQIETDFEMLIPDEYVNSIQERRGVKKKTGWGRVSPGSRNNPFSKGKLRQVKGRSG